MLLVREMGCEVKGLTLRALFVGERMSVSRFAGGEDKKKKKRKVHICPIQAEARIRTKELRKLLKWFSEG